jgi:DNA topoisomerase-1
VSAEASTGRLRYSSDAERGYSRLRRGEAFAYRDTRGRALRGAETVERIRKLGIPPAWTDVWICADPNGHLQATGRDARGRKQYRYHPKWRLEQEAGKFERLREFGESLPAIRKKVRAHLALPGLPREKVLAIIVRLLERTAIRVGNEKYARENESFGLTTLRNKHVRVRGERIEFDFKGKSGKVHRVALDDPRLAKLVSHCRDLPGYELFQYLDDDGQTRSIGSADVNDYLREISGREVTAKDFRTWIGSVSVACALARAEEPMHRSTLKAAIEDAARLLGNTPTICRKSYVHPSVQVPAMWVERLKALRRPRRHAGLREEERLLMSVLEVADASPAELLKASLAKVRRKAAARPGARVGPKLAMNMA